MDIEYLLVLQDFREGAGQFLRELFMKMTFLTDKETSIVIVAIIYWCITPILNMFNTAAGASTNVTSTTILASLENCIDRTVFNKAKE